jgi:pimeloyl-ACP methyl ester carboxylesterase
VLLGSTTTAPLAAAARAVAARLPQGRLVELAGSGHTAMDDDPLVFASVLLDTLGVAKV